MINSLLDPRFINPVNPGSTLINVGELYDYTILRFVQLLAQEKCKKQPI